MAKPQTYTITRLDGWTDELWDEIIDAVEETVVAVSDDWDNTVDEDN